MRICKECGTEIFIEEANFCWICGAELEGEEILMKDGDEVYEKGVAEDGDGDCLFAFEISANGEKILTKFADRNAKHVEIPSDVTSIKDSVFEDYHEIESIILPEGLKSIGNKCFKNCTSLKEINLPVSLSSLGNEVFIACERADHLLCSSKVALRFLCIYILTQFDQTACHDCCR